MGLLFIPPKPRQFQYRPMYYNERKERLEKMKARAEAELAAGKENAVHTGLERGFLAEGRSNSKLRRVEIQKASNVRLLRFFIILFALLLIVYYIVPEAFTAFWKIK